MMRKVAIVLCMLVVLGLTAASVVSFQRRAILNYYREPVKDSSFSIAVERLSVRLWEWTFVDSPRQASSYEGAVLGFGLMVRRMKTPTGRTLLAHRITLPVPFLISVFAVYPLVALLRGPIARWRRGRQGHCRKCGYNLTGNVTGICPECGRKISHGATKPRSHEGR